MQSIDVDDEVDDFLNMDEAIIRAANRALGRQMRERCCRIHQTGAGQTIKCQTTGNTGDRAAPEIPLPLDDTDARQLHGVVKQAFRQRTTR